MQATNRIAMVRRRRAILSVLLFGLGCALLIQALGWAQTSNYALVKALSHGTARIDRYHWETRDEAYYRGHYYSVKAPGLAFVSLPLYEALHGMGADSVSRKAAETARASGAGRWVQGSVPITLYGADFNRAARIRQTIEDETVMVWALGLLTAVIPAMLLLWLIRALGERLEPGFGTVAALTLGFGTLVMPFATLFFSHVLAALLGFAAFALAWKEREGPRRLALLAGAGLLAGLAVTTEYPLAIVAGIVGVYAVGRGDALRRGAAFAAGCAAGVAPLLAYNLWAFGSITHFSYEDAVSVQGFTGHDVLGLNDGGFFGITDPSAHVALQLLFSAKGLLTISPVLALGVLGAVLLYRRGKRAEALVIGAVGIAFLAYNSGYYLPFGGGSPGPRFLTPVLPFLALPLALTYKRFPAVTVALAIPSALLTIAATTTLPMIGNDDIGAWTHLVGAGVFEHTIVSVLGGDDSWGAIMPVFAALAGSAVLALKATPRVSLSRGTVRAITVLACWWGVAVLGAWKLSGHEAQSGRTLVLIAGAALASLITVLAAVVVEQRPWERGWVGRAEPQRELSS